VAGSRIGWIKLLLAPIGALILIGLIGSPIDASSAPAELSYSVHDLPVTQNQDPPNAVSCTPSGLCLAITYGGDIFELSGSRYIPAIATGTSVTAVSCPSNSFCAAVGGSSSAMIIRSNGISRYILTSRGPNSVVHWESVSCPTSNFCMAGGGIIQGPHSGAGVVASWDGRRWSVAKVVDPFLASDTHTFISSMSCTSPSFCVAADGNNRTLQWNGAMWSFPHPLNQRTIDASFNISCTSSTFCLAVGQFSPDVFSWNGLRWSHRPRSPFNNDSVELSCITTTFCVAVEDEGKAMLWNGKAWSVPQTVDPNNYFNAISCSSAWVCEAVGTNDDFVYLHNTHKTPHLPPLCRTFRCSSTTV
jgi:hypothetical protein